MKLLWAPITSEVVISSPSIWKEIVQIIRSPKIIEDEPRLCPRCTSASSFSFNAESEGFSWATSLSEVSSEKPAKTKSMQTDISITELHFVNALPTNRKEEPPARLPCYVAGRQSQNVARLYWSISPLYCQPPRPNIKVQWVDPGPSTSLAMESWGTKKARSWSMAWWPDDHEWDRQIICGISFGWSHSGWSTLVKCCLKFEWLNRHFTAWLKQKTHGAHHSTSTWFLWRYGESVVQIKYIWNSCRHHESRTPLRHTSCSLPLNPSAWLPQKPANASSPHSFQGCFRIPMMVGPRNYGLSLQLRLL